MSDLKEGDNVQVGANTFSPVYYFSHKDSQSSSTFHRFLGVDGTVLLTVSSEHLVIVVSDGDHQSLKAAKEVLVGDLLPRVAPGASSKELAMVASIDMMSYQGLYHPHTALGQIVVDGTLVSTWTSYFHPRVASFLLALPRALSRFVGPLALPDASPVVRHWFTKALGSI